MKTDYRKYILLILMLSIIIKLLFLFTFDVYQAPQAFEYEQVAENLLKGKGFYYDRFGTKYYAGIAPAYPILCYMVYKIFSHNTLWIVFIQIVITSLLVIPIFFISLQIFGKQTAFFASILCAIQPQLIIYSTNKLHSMNIYAFVFALLVLAFLSIKNFLTLRSILFVGFIAGLAILFRITSLVFVILGIFWFCITAHYENKKKLQAAVLIILISFALILPWGIRNYIVFGRPILLQTNKWESLWFGNMPGSSGSLYTEEGVTVLERGQNDLPQEFFEMNEIEQGQYLKKLTIGYFKKDPPAFIIRILKKMYYFWYFSPYQGTLYPRLWLRLYKVYYLIVLFPAVLSIIYNFASRKKFDKTAALLVMLLFLAITCAHSLYFVEGRHRWSIESLILIFTANGFIILKEWFKKIIKHKLVRAV